MDLGEKMSLMFLVRITNKGPGMFCEKKFDFQFTLYFMQFLKTDLFYTSSFQFVSCLRGRHKNRNLNGILLTAFNEVN